MQRRQLAIALFVAAALLLGIGLHRGATPAAPVAPSLRPLERAPLVTVRATTAPAVARWPDVTPGEPGPALGRRCEPTLLGAASSGDVHALGRAEGFELFGAGLPTPVQSAQHLVPAAVGHGRVVALDAARGLVYLFDFSASRRAQPEFTASAVLGPHPRGFLFEESGALVLRDPDLRELARVTLPAPRASGPVVGAAGEVLIATTDEAVYGYDAGLAPRFEVRLDADVTATPVASADGGWLVVSARGALVALAADGQVRASVQLPGPVHRGLAIEADGSVLVAIGGPTPRVVRIDASLRRVRATSAPRRADDDGREFGSVLAVAPGGDVVLGARDQLERLDPTLKTVQRIDVVGLPSRIDRGATPVVRVDTCLFGFGASGFAP